MRRNFRVAFGLSLLLFFGSLAGPGSSIFAQSEQRIQLDIQVIHATRGAPHIDVGLEKLVQSFSSLDFTAYRLKDEMKIEVRLGSSTRVQLPNGMWMQVQAKASKQPGMLQLGISADKPKFKTTVNVKKGATIAVGGPPFEQGSLIFSITRRKGGG